MSKPCQCAAPRSLSSHAHEQKACDGYCSLHCGWNSSLVRTRSCQVGFIDRVRPPLSTQWCFLIVCLIQDFSVFFAKVPVTSSGAKQGVVKKPPVGWLDVHWARDDVYNVNVSWGSRGFRPKSAWLKNYFAASKFWNNVILWQGVQS